MTVKEFTEEDEFVRISENLKPKSREDGSYRLAYLTATLSMLSSSCISENLSLCRRGDLGETVRALAAEPVPYESFAESIKHLTCIILYLISLEQGEGSPDWLADFLSSSVRAMDQIVKGSPVREIMSRYANVAGDEIYSRCPANLMLDLGFAGEAENASRPLKEYLAKSAARRSQIIHFALSQEREQIEKQWREIIAQNTLALD